MLRLGKISRLGRFDGRATITDLNKQKIDFLVALTSEHLYKGMYIWFEIISGKTGLEVSNIIFLSLSKPFGQLFFCYAYSESAIAMHERLLA